MQIMKMVGIGEKWAEFVFYLHSDGRFLNGF